MFPFLRWLPMVTRQSLREDAAAGITGALIVLPQGVAFATIAGLPPEYGLYAAMMPAVVAALFGSSWHLVSGPTTAISIALFATLAPLAAPGSEQYVRLALTLTFLTGVMQLALGLARLGALINFISHTVVIGFTAGAAILIAASQVRNFFGIAIPRGTPVHEILRELFTRSGEINPYVLAVAVLTLACAIASRRYFPKFPYMISAMIAGGFAAAALDWAFGAEVTKIAKVGALPSHLPPLSAPDFSAGALAQTFRPALVITLLALTEAVSIARAVAVRSEQRIDGNQEFIGQGLSNIVGAFFSGYASSGSFNRSGVNYEAGARTPLATVLASAALALIVLLVAPLAAWLPNAAMAGILFLVAWGLIDFHHIRSILRTSKPESFILAATLIGTLVKIEEGIFLGVLLSLVFYLYRSSRPEIEPVVPAPEQGSYHFVDAKGRPECPQLRIVRINGSIYFGAVSHVQGALQEIDEANPRQKTVLVAASGINFVDVAGAEMLAAEARRRRRLGGGLYFYRLKPSVQRFLDQGEYTKHIGAEAFFPVMTNVTGKLYWRLDPDVCRTCRTRIFSECHGAVLPGGLRRQRLMLATDGSAFAEAPTAVAIALAARFGVTLDVVTVVAAHDAGEVARARLEAVSRRAIPEDVDCEPAVRVGTDAVRVLIEAADDAGANILVIGRRPPGKGIVQRMVGDVASRIIAGAPCHVLVASPGTRMWTRRILLATDGSRFSEIAAGIAAELARVCHLPVSVVSVVKPGGRDAGTVREDTRSAAAALRVQGIEADALTVEGRPGALIVAKAEELGADLIVVGSHGRRGLNRVMLGSVSDEVVGSAHCAVLVAKPAIQPEELLSAIAPEL
ncbi:MAG: hypothetical protein Fur0039_04900 [Rhodocyclaceae bacterium]